MPPLDDLAVPAQPVNEVLWAQAQGAIEKAAATVAELRREGGKVHPSPSEAQREAGNYRKGHVRHHGLSISIENPKGSVRSGVSKDGKRWQTTMKSHYGYVRGTRSEADGDHVDVFIAEDHPESELVFVIDQVDPETGGFDEHKCILGTADVDTAEKRYLENYERGWQGLGNITAMTLPQFRWWLQHGDTGHAIEDGAFARRPGTRKAADGGPRPAADGPGGPGHGAAGDPGGAGAAGPAAADFAPGLPARRDLGDLSRLQPGQLHDLFVQSHSAARAGHHFDIRFGRPETGLYSWATRKELPQPGERVGIFRQPQHRFDYGSFEGEIPPGSYGAGTVKTHAKGQVLVTHVEPGLIRLTTAHERYPQRYALVGDDHSKNWLLVNTTPQAPLPYQKVHYKRVPREEVHKVLAGLDPQAAVQAKIDGASSLTKLVHGRAELFSYRTSKQTGRPITHSERVFQGKRPRLDYPKALEGTVLKGELYGVRSGAGGREEVIPPHELGGILNSALGKALERQSAGKVRLRNALFDIQQHGGSPVDLETVPYAERRRLLEEVVRHLPPDVYHLAPQVEGPEAGRKLWEEIGAGRHGLTQEGVVIHPATGRPLKAKYLEDADTYVTGTFPGAGRRAATIGGITYGLEPGGPTVGRVGTGFDDQTLRDIAADPAAYLGRVARIRSQGQFASGAHRAPSFLAFHEDITPGDAEKTEEIPVGINSAKAGADCCATCGEGCPIDALPAEPFLKPGDGPKTCPECGATHQWRGKKAEIIPPELLPPLSPCAADGSEKRNELDAELFPLKAAAAADGPVARLLKAKWHSDARDYAAKHQVLRDLIAERPDEFREDSRAGGIIGITHLPSGFRIHAVAAAVPALKKQADLKPDVPLQPHQKEVAETGLEDEARMLIYHQVGAGKSLASIAGAENAGEPYTAVTPASLRPNYKGEIARWTDQKTPHQIVSYNSLARGQVEPTPTVVMDEVHRTRNPHSLTTQHALELARQAKHLYLLTGTPVVNHPHDVAPLIEMLTGKHYDPEEFDRHFIDERKLSPGFWGWLQGVEPAKVPALKNEQELEDLLRGHVHYYAPARPPVATNEEHVTTELGPEQTRLYQSFWNQLPWLYRWKLQHSFPLSHQEMIRLSSFLSGPRQVSLSTYPFMKGQGDPLQAFRQSPKLQKAMELMTAELKSDPAARGVAFSNFIAAGLSPYAAALREAGIPYGTFHGKLNDAARRQAVADYNAGKSRVLLLGPSGGEGISLKGTRLLQILDPHWNSARSDQAVGRGVRYDSHLDLPLEDRNVRIQRFVSHLPKSPWQRMWRAVFGTKPEDEDPRKSSPGVDQYLEAMAAKKDTLNVQFLDLLKRIGSEKRAALEDAADPPFHPALVVVRHTMLALLPAEAGARENDDEAGEDEVPFTVAVDLDGTLAKEGPYDSETIPAPRRGARAALEKFRNAGYRILVNTCRGDTELVADWMHEHGIPFDEVNANSRQPAGTSAKLMADVYIDDRALDARQPWDAITEEVFARARTKEAALIVVLAA